MPFFQDVDAKLTLTRVATAPVLIAEIAKSSGNRLEVSPSLSAEVLMVSVENARVADVLAKLAIAATAVWQPIEGGLRLVPDTAARSIEASSERARRLLAVTDGLKKKQAEAAKRQAAMAEAARKGAAKKKDDEEAVFAESFGGMFGGGKIDAFVPLLDLTALANMEMGDRIVFATSPNAAQRPLRGNPATLIQKWIVEHNQAVKGVGGSEEGMPEEMAAFMKGPMGDRMKRMSQPITAVPAKVVVVASRGSNALMMFGGGDMGLEVSVEVRAYAANGALLLEESGSIDTDMLSFVAALAEGKKPSAPSDKTTPIEYSEDAKAFIAAEGSESPLSGGDFDKGLKLSPSLHEKLFLPDKFDPLALVPGEGLAALAKARRKPLVASIPDEAYPGALDYAIPKTVEDVEAA